MNEDFVPAYRQLMESNQLEARVERAKYHLTECYLCPHKCGVNREKELGFCRASREAMVSDYGPHFGEERVLVGKNGSGTIFFGYCNMRCVFCQNCQLSFGGQGYRISNEQLADYMLSLQYDYQCHNINLVTPTHFVANILEALYLAAHKGLNLPLVYNCGGYERIETLKLLDGVIDIYMPDFKYNTEGWGEKYSKVKNYPEMIKRALKEMDCQVGGLKTDKQGIAYRGMIIRHLMLPGGIENTKEVLKFIKQELSPDCMVNLMDQYYPAHQASQYHGLSKPLSHREFLEAYIYAKKLGLNLSQ